MAWRNRIIGYAEVDPNDLLANPRNWRIHPQNQQESLEAVLEEVGFVDDIIVNQKTGFVVDGHLRVALALRHEQTSVPVKYVDLDENEELIILATLDPLAAMAATDVEKLGELMQIVSTDDDRMKKMLTDLAFEQGVGIPDFFAGGEDEQARLDQPGAVECPECGHVFKPTHA